MNSADPDPNRNLHERIASLERQVDRLRYEVFTARAKTWRARLRPNLFVFEQYLPRQLRLPEHYSRISPPSPAPSIAIVTPSMNQARFVERTISSVLEQNYPNLHYAIQDGNSDDGSINILRQYSDRMSLSVESDNGQAEAINRGFTRVAGDIMGWLNSDDVLMPGALAYVARFFQENSGIDLVYGHRIYIDTRDRETGRCILPNHDSAALLHFDYIPQETLFWRRRVWDALGGLDHSFEYALDWDFVLRAQAAGFRFKRLPRFLGGFRVHDGQKTTRHRELGEAEMARLRRQHLGSQHADAAGRFAMYRYYLKQTAVAFAFRRGLVAY